jgi:hypothetical protein
MKNNATQTAVALGAIALIAYFVFWASGAFAQAAYPQQLPTNPQQETHAQPSPTPEATASPAVEVASPAPAAIQPSSDHAVLSVSGGDELVSWDDVRPEGEEAWDPLLLPADAEERDCERAKAEALEYGWFVESCDPLRVWSVEEARAMGLL